MEEITGGTPYGATTLAGADGRSAPSARANWRSLVSKATTWPKLPNAFVARAD
jgi:hypothetical protein